MGGRWAAALVLLCLCGCGDGRGQRSPSGVRLLDERIDFGRVALGSRTVRRIRLRNEGDAPRRIRLWREGASTFRHGLSSFQIAPGESMEIPVTHSALVDGRSRGALVLLSEEGPPLRAELVAEVQTVSSNRSR